MSWEPCKIAQKFQPVGIPYMHCKRAVKFEREKCAHKKNRKSLDTVIFLCISF